MNFTEMRQIVCKLFKLSTKFLTVPRIYLFGLGFELKCLKDDTDMWLQLNGPVNFSYFYSKCYLKLVL